jgi:hypothetical protein
MEDFVSDDENNGMTYFQIMAHRLGKQGMRTLLEDIPPAVDKVKEKFDELTSRDKDMEELNETFKDTGDFMDEFFNKALAEQSEKAQESAEAFHQLGIEIKSGDIARAEADIMRTAIGLKGISDTAARAALHGKNMGDAFVLALRSIAMELAAQAASFAILNLLTGGGLSASKSGFSLLGSIIGHTGGSVTQNGIQAFTRGGTVRGGDNVPILAQAGEFIIRRDSAQSIGLDTLRQMNETGQPSSNIVVNIHGGVVQDDYVRNELIPALNSAVNSGARIDA